MDAERMRWWGEQLEDELVAEQLVAARSAVVRPVPDELAASHLDAIMAEQARAAADGAASRPLATLGGLLRQRFTVAVATTAAAAALALVLALAGTLPDPAQRMMADAAETVGVELPRPQPPISERYVDPGGWRDGDRPDEDERSQADVPTAAAPSSGDGGRSDPARAADTTQPIAADRGDLPGASEHLPGRSGDTRDGAGDDGDADPAPGDEAAAAGNSDAAPGHQQGHAADQGGHADRSQDAPSRPDQRRDGPEGQAGKGSDAGEGRGNNDAQDGSSGPRTAGASGVAKLSRPDEQGQGSDQGKQQSGSGQGADGNDGSGKK